MGSGSRSLWDHNCADLIGNAPLRRKPKMPVLEYLFEKITDFQRVAFSPSRQFFPDRSHDVITL
jgi:hypothetical protein